MTIIRDVTSFPDRADALCLARGLSLPDQSDAAAGQRGRCNGCNGRRYNNHPATDYPFSAENVADFVAFVRHSGGFGIW